MTDFHVHAATVASFLTSRDGKWSARFYGNYYGNRLYFVAVNSSANTTSVTRPISSICSLVNSLRCVSSSFLLLFCFVPLLSLHLFLDPDFTPSLRVCTICCYPEERSSWPALMLLTRSDHQSVAKHTRKTLIKSIFLFSDCRSDQLQVAIKKNTIFMNFAGQQPQSQPTKI